MIKSKTKRMTTIAMLISISVVFHMIESMIPIPLPIPGFRLGLANIIGLITLYMLDARIMLTVNIMRVLLASLLRGILFGSGFWLSLSGVLLSSCASILAYKKTPMSMYGVSMAGSVFHAVGQVVVITWMYQQFFMQAVLPILIFLGLPTGFLIACIAKEVLKRIKIT